MHVVVIVLGDLGRSPRMQYHTLSLLQAGHSVSVVGYKGEELIPDLKDWLLQQQPSPSEGEKRQRQRQRFHVVRFLAPTPPKALQSLRLFYFFWRICSLAVWLGWALFFSVPSRREHVDCLLVQNPPALPLFAVALFYCWTKGFLQRQRPALIIDWHNLGYSMLNPGIFRKIARVYERALAPLADGHLTVTKAMRDFLLREMRLKESSNVSVLYDCPPAMFQPLQVKEQHEILSKLDETLCAACPRSWHASKDPDRQTLFTELHEDNEYRHRPGRPAFLITSTSWTPDEDFGLLLAALQRVDENIRNEKSSLNVLVVVTGKGPQKAHYEEEISRLAMRHVAIQTVWLEPADYPRLLACADMGVSLHTSTSGLDLPMKVLDMFGCEVPVCAVNFACLHELVQDGVNGRVFDSIQQLSEQLNELLKPLADDNTQSMPNHSFGVLQAYSEQLKGRDRWSQNWTAHALPVIIKATANQD